MADVNLRQVKKSYGNLNILHGIDLDIKSGEFIVFVGPSGCGKSTLLRSIAGLEEITSGELKIDGDVVNDVPPSKRGIAMSAAARRRCRSRRRPRQRARRSVSACGRKT